jgi:exonuclease SbcD
LVKDTRLDYVAMGHIHKPQDVNKGNYPPVIYPGSIERVDFGEALDDKFYVVAEVARNGTTFQWRKIDGTRPFIERRAVIRSMENVTQYLVGVLPSPDQMAEAIIKLTVEYPRELDVLIDEVALRRHCECAFEFHLAKRPKSDARVRIPEGQTVSSLSPLELLTQYFETARIEESDELQNLAREILAEDSLDL